MFYQELHSLKQLLRSPEWHNFPDLILPDKQGVVGWENLKEKLRLLFAVCFLEVTYVVIQTAACRSAELSWKNDSSFDCLDGTIFDPVQSSIPV